MRTGLAIFSFIIVMLFATPAATLAQKSAGVGGVVTGEEAIPTLVVSGVSELEVDPDELRLTLSVVSEGGDKDSLRDLMRDNSRQIDRVIRALSDLGVDRDDIETSRFNVFPRYTNPSGGEPRQIAGYRVENQILVETPLLDEAGRLVQAAIDAGANRVTQIAFGLRNRREHRAAAIADAAGNARADAEALASAAGVSLLRALRIELDQPQFQPFNPMPRQEMMARSGGAGGDAAPAPAITPGRITVRASVTIRYEIVPADGGR